MTSERATPGALLGLAVLGLVGAWSAGCPAKRECSHDVDCPGSQVCSAGACVFPACEGGCDPGEYCEGARCLPCDDDRHCGGACTDCSAQAENQACIDGACGCASQADCREQQLCYQAACTWCVPDCSTRCCGNDGCGGRCPDRCAQLGQVCNPDACRCEQACEPVGCDGLGVECGQWDDGCGQPLACGDCPVGDVCSAAGECVGPPRPHEGAGDACTCEGASCSVPCPEAPDAASVCLVTNEPALNDGLCSFACSGPGRDADCRLDFAAGCCLGFGALYYCVDRDHCPDQRQYLQTCGQVDGACDADLVCVLLLDGDPAYCLWSCDYPDGACPDGGECIGLQGGGGACLPRGDLPAGALCHEPLYMCGPDLRCLTPRAAYMGFCSPGCDCQGGQGCADPADCFWSVQEGADVTCWCGLGCADLDPTLDCPNAYEWTCADVSGAGDPFFACVPALASP